MRLADALGGTLPVIIFPLIGAGTGRTTRFGTARGLYNGAAWRRHPLDSASVPLVPECGERYIRVAA